MELKVKINIEELVSLIRAHLDRTIGPGDWVIHDKSYSSREYEATCEWPVPIEPALVEKEPGE